MFDLIFKNRKSKYNPDNTVCEYVILQYLEQLDSFQYSLIQDLFEDYICYLTINQQINQNSASMINSYQTSFIWTCIIELLKNHKFKPLDSKRLFKKVLKYVINNDLLSLQQKENILKSFCINIFQCEHLNVDYEDFPKILIYTIVFPNPQKINLKNALTVFLAIINHIEFSSKLSNNAHCYLDLKEIIKWIAEKPTFKRIFHHINWNDVELIKDSLQQYEMACNSAIKSDIQLLVSFPQINSISVNESAKEFIFFVFMTDFHIDFKDLNDSDVAWVSQKFIDINLRGRYEFFLNFWCRNTSLANLYIQDAIKKFQIFRNQKCNSQKQLIFQHVYWEPES